MACGHNRGRDARAPRVGFATPKNVQSPGTRVPTVEFFHSFRGWGEGAGAVERRSCEFTYVALFSSRVTFHVSRRQLKNPCCPHASTHAHRYHAKLDLTPPHFVQQRCRELRSGTTQWMSERNRSTIHIHLARV